MEFYDGHDPMAPTTLMIAPLEFRRTGVEREYGVPSYLIGAADVLYYHRKGVASAEVAAIDAAILRLYASDQARRRVESNTIVRSPARWSRRADAFPHQRPSLDAAAVALRRFRSRSRDLTANFVSERARSRTGFPGSEARAASRAITATFADLKALFADKA